MPGTDGMDGGDASLAPTGFKAMERKDLQRLCAQKRIKANGTTKSMVAALEASMCSDMAAVTGWSPWECCRGWWWWHGPGLKVDEPQRFAAFVRPKEA